MSVGNNKFDNIIKLNSRRRITSCNVHDPLADTITRLKNGYMRKLNYVYVIKSKFIISVLDKLSMLGYIGNIVAEERDIKVYLVYLQHTPIIDYLKCLSTPGRRLTTSVNNIPRSRFGVAGEFLLSTSKGIITDTEARTINQGGELLLEVFSCRK